MDDFRVIEPASAQEPPLQAPMDSRTLRPSIYFVTILGLLIAFPTLFFTGRLASSLAAFAGLSVVPTWVVASIASTAIQIPLIFGIVVFIERRRIASLGLVRPTLSDLGLGLALFAACGFFSTICVVILRLVFPRVLAQIAPDQMKLMMRLPVPAMIAIALAAGFGEEIAERGFVFDRIRSTTGNAGFAVTAVLALAVGAHISFWGWRYSILLIPTELLLTLFYLWRGNLWPNIVAHSLIDSSPMLIQLAMIATVSLFGARSFPALLGDFRYRYGDYPGAAAQYTRALKLAPGDAGLLSNRAGAEVMNHDYPAAIADLDAAIHADPDSPNLLIQRAMAFFYSGYYAQAKADASQAIAAAPALATLYQQRAKIEKWIGQPGESIADLDQAIKLSKSPAADMYADRGQAYQSKGDYASAARDLKTAVKLNPRDTESMLALASAFQEQKDYAHAVTASTRLLERDSANADAHVSRADAYWSLGQYQAALDDYRAAVRLDPKNAVAANGLSWFLCTCPAATMRDGKRALVLASRACELSQWGQFGYVDTLAAAYAELGNFPEAVAWQQHAIDLAGPDSALKTQLQQRLELYRKRLPYREDHPD